MFGEKKEEVLGVGFDKLPPFKMVDYIHRRYLNMFVQVTIGFTVHCIVQDIYN